MVYKVDFESAAWESPIPGMRHKFLDQGGRRLRLVEYTPEMAPHWCEKGHIGYVLSGTFEIAFDREVHVYGPGDGVFLPPGKDHRHMGKVLSDAVRIVFVEDC